MSSVERLREVVRNLADTFNDPKIRESSYFDFYDDSLNIHGFPPNLPTIELIFTIVPLRCFLIIGTIAFISLINPKKLVSNSSSTHFYIVFY
ncbi:MAG TPA: hypothetical protein VH481_09095 [Nitrososphaeraceae archaeon]|jgi:hypothetical protein